MSEKLLTASDIADVLQMDLSHVYKLIAREMKHHHIGVAVRVSVIDFETWLAEKRVSPTGGARSVPAANKRAKQRTGASKGDGIRPSQIGRKAS